ncbi:MAG: hypothetical protein WAN65_32945 [Candidatus Sulfotelmatobacter sp.]
MDALTFVERLIHDLAWPLTVLILAYLFRFQVEDVIRRISRLKFRGADFTFDREREELDNVRRNLPSPKVRIPDLDSTSTTRRLPPGSPPKEEIQPVEAKAISAPKEVDHSLSPRGVVEQSWLRLELSLRELQYREGESTPRSIKSLLARLVDHQLLTPELQTAITQLHSTYAQLLKARGHIPDGIVEDFVKTADRIQLSLQNQANL